LSNDQLTRIEKKIDAHGEHLFNIDKTLGAQAVILKEHIRRTEANERAIDFIHKLHLKVALALIGAMFMLIVGLIKWSVG
jgi:hypothetical protein